MDQPLRLSALHLTNLVKVSSSSFHHAKTQKCRTRAAQEFGVSLLLPVPLSSLLPKLRCQMMSFGTSTTICLTKWSHLEAQSGRHQNIGIIFPQNSNPYEPRLLACQFSQDIPKRRLRCLRCTFAAPAYLQLCMLISPPRLRWHYPMSSMTMVIASSVLSTQQPVD